MKIYWIPECQRLFFLRRLVRPGKGGGGVFLSHTLTKKKKGIPILLKCQFLAKGCDSIEIEEKFWIKIWNCWKKWVFVFNCFKIFNAITNQLYFNILLGLKPEEEFFFSLNSPLTRRWGRVRDLTGIGANVIRSYVIKLFCSYLFECSLLQWYHSRCIWRHQ